MAGNKNSKSSPSISTGNGGISANVLGLLKNRAGKQASRGGVIHCQFFVKDKEKADELCKKLDDLDILYERKEMPDGTTMIMVTGMKDENGNEIHGSLQNSAPVERERKPQNGTYEVITEGREIWHPTPSDKPEGYPVNPSKEKIESGEATPIDRKEWGESGGDGLIGDVEKLMNEHNKRNGNPEDFRFEGVVFDSTGNPDLSPFSVGTVKTDFYSTDRAVNFKQADELMAIQLNERYRKEHNGADREPPYTAGSVKSWRENKNHRMTWHEDPDCQTMMKVPSILHGNMAHNGGVSEERRRGSEVFRKEGLQIID